eukprot:gene1663-33059_t
MRGVADLDDSLHYVVNADHWHANITLCSWTMVEAMRAGQFVFGLDGTNNLDAYLASRGLSAPRLLPPFGAGPPQVQIRELGSEEEGDDDPVASLIRNIVNGVAWATEQLAPELARLGAWLRQSRCSTTTSSQQLTKLEDWAATVA